MPRVGVQPAVTQRPMAQPAKNRSSIPPSHQGTAGTTVGIANRYSSAPADRSAGSVLEPPMCLNDLISKPAYTFLVRVQGHSLVQAGIIDGDLLVVDRSVKHRNNDFVVAAVQGELTVKRIEYRNGKVRLVSANPEYPPIDIIEDMRFEVLGVVTHVVHFMR